MWVWNLQSDTMSNTSVDSGVVSKHFYETKVWLISILMIKKQGLELMILFQVWLGKMISKVAITKTNQAKEKSWRKENFKEKCFSRPNLHKISL